MRRIVITLTFLLGLLYPGVAAAQEFDPGRVVRASEFRVTPSAWCEGPYKVRIVFKVELREDPRFIGGASLDGVDDPNRIVGDIDIGDNNPTMVVNLPDGNIHTVRAKAELFSSYVPDKGLASGDLVIPIACPPPLGPPPPPGLVPPDCDCPKHEGKKHKRHRCLDCRGCRVKIKGPRVNPAHPSSPNVYRVVMKCKGKKVRIKKAAWYLDGYRVHVGKVWRVTSGQIQTHGRLRGEHVIEVKVRSKKGCKDFKRILVDNLDP